MPPELKPDNQQLQGLEEKLQVMDEAIKKIEDDPQRKANEKALAELRAKLKKLSEDENLEQLHEDLNDQKRFARRQAKSDGELKPQLDARDKLAAEVEAFRKKLTPEPVPAPKKDEANPTEEQNAAAAPVAAPEPEDEGFGDDTADEAAQQESLREKAEKENKQERTEKQEKAAEHDAEEKHEAKGPPSSEPVRALREELKMEPVAREENDDLKQAKGLGSTPTLGRGG